MAQTSYTRPPTADVLPSTLPSHVQARAIAMSPAAVNLPAANRLIFTGDDLCPPHNHQLPDSTKTLAVAGVVFLITDGYHPLGDDRAEG